MKKPLLSLILFYQKYLSLDTGLVRFVIPSNKTCRYFPTCSEYCYQAVEKYGILKGCWVGLQRILRCHPFSKGGNDPLK